MRGILITCIAFVFAVGSATVRAGVVRTLEGKTYNGEIAFDAPNAIAVIGAGAKVEVPAGDVLQANFRARTGASLPAPWMQDDIGDVATGSAAWFSGGVFSLKGAQANAGLDFVHRQLLGDGEISARVLEIQNARLAYAGVVMRNDPTPQSPFVALVINPAGNAELIYRAKDGATVQTTPATKLILPCWLKLTRQGRRFVGYKSIDGRNFEPMDPAVAADLSRETQVGLGVCSADKSVVVTARFDNVNIVGATPTRLSSAVMSEGVVLKDGTAIPGKIASADETSVTLSNNRGRQATLLPTAQVARLLFAPVPARQIPTNRTGALLTSSDFFDGEFKHFSENTVRISSVLFGIKTFTIGSQVAAVILADPARPATSFVIRLTDGAVIPCDNLQIANDHLTVSNPALGTMTLSPRDIDRIDRSGTAFESLCDLSPTVSKDGAFAMDSTLNGLSADLPDMQVGRCIGLASGTELTYSLDGRYRSFIGTLGVPAGLLPYAPVRLIIQGDGQEIYRSPWITSVDDPIALAVSLVGKSQLRLKLESAGGGGQLIIADPLLIRK